MCIRDSFDAMQASPEVAGAQKLLLWLQREGRMTFTGRDAHRAIDRKGRRVELTDPVLEVLEAHGFIRPVHAEELGRNGRRRGRPPELYRVNPRAFDDRRVAPMRRAEVRVSAGASESVQSVEASAPRAVRHERPEAGAPREEAPRAPEPETPREPRPGDRAPDDPLGFD